MSEGLAISARQYGRWQIHIGEKMVITEAKQKPRGPTTLFNVHILVVNYIPSKHPQQRRKSLASLLSCKKSVQNPDQNLHDSARPDRWAFRSSLARQVSTTTYGPVEDLDN